MKKLLLCFFLCIYLPSVSLAQSLLWSVYDLHQLINYDRHKDLFNLNFVDQNIREINMSDDNTILLLLDDFKIKFLPANLIVYSKENPEDPLYYSYTVPFSHKFYYKLYKEDWDADMSNNSWFKTNEPAMDVSDIKYRVEKEEYRNRYVISYPLNNYSFKDFNVVEISDEEIISRLLFNTPGLWFNLEASNSSYSNFVSDIKNFSESNHQKIFKSVSYCPVIKDIKRDSSGCIWIAAVKNLIRYDGKKFYMIDIPATSLEIDNRNNLWIGTAAYNSIGSLIKYDGKTFSFFNSLNSPLPENAGINDISIDRFGNLWIAFKRKNLNGALDNLKLVVFNETGLNILPVANGFSVTSMLYYTEILTSKFLTYQMNLNASFDNVDLNTRFDLYSDNELLFQKTFKDFPDRQIEINHIIEFYKPKKYNLKLYSLDSLNNRSLLADSDIDMRFNELGFFLSDNEPDPFSSITKIEFGLEGTDVELKVFDYLGKEVYKLAVPRQYMYGPPYFFDGKDHPNGVYFYYLKEKYKGILDSKKMILFDYEKIITLPH